MNTVCLVSEAEPGPADGRADRLCLCEGPLTPELSEGRTDCCQKQGRSRHWGSRSGDPTPAGQKHGGKQSRAEEENAEGEGVQGEVTSLVPPNLGFREYLVLLLVRCGETTYIYGITDINSNFC